MMKLWTRQPNSAPERIPSEGPRHDINHLRPLLCKLPYRLRPPQYPFPYPYPYQIHHRAMPAPTPSTAVFLTDPYNDFLHPSGKLYPLLSTSIQKTNTIRHLQAVVAAARKAKIPIYYGLHQQCRPGFLDGWKRPTATQISQKDGKAFEEGSWGVEIYEGLQPDLASGDVVVSKHWGSRYAV